MTHQIESMVQRGDRLVITCACGGSYEIAQGDYEIGQLWPAQIKHIREYEEANNAPAKWLALSELTLSAIQARATAIRLGGLTEPADRGREITLITIAAMAALEVERLNRHAEKQKVFSKVFGEVFERHGSPPSVARIFPEPDVINWLVRKRDAYRTEDPRWFALNRLISDYFSDARLKTQLSAYAKSGPQRGDAVEHWLKRERDVFFKTDARWSALDDLLDDYRLHSDTWSRLSVPTSALTPGSETPGGEESD